MYKKYLSDLTDGELKFLKKCLPKQKKFGKPRKYDRRLDFERHFLLVADGLCGAVFAK